MEQIDVVSLIQNIVRDAMAIREDSFVKNPSHDGRPMLTPSAWSPGRYSKSISFACEEACEKHKFPALFPVIHAAISGGWNEMDSWVNL